MNICRGIFLSLFQLSAIFCAAAFSYVSRLEAQQRIYWLDSTANQLIRANLDGSNQVTLITFVNGVESPNQLAIDELNNKIYWTDTLLTTVQRANLDGTNRESLVGTTVVNPKDIQVSPVTNQLFYISGNQIKRANLDGSGAITYQTASVGFNIVSMTLDPLSGWVVYGEREGMNYLILRSPLPAINGGTVFANVPSIGGFAARLNTQQAIFTDFVSLSLQQVQYEPANPTVTELTPSAGLNQIRSVVLSYNEADAFFTDDAVTGIFHTPVVAPNVTGIIPAARPSDIALDCGRFAVNQDGDTQADCREQCPLDASKLVPGICGCGTPDVDSDVDGTLDCQDGCPNDIFKTSPGACGCGNAETDSDFDGSPNCIDVCLFDPGKIVPGDCGCGVPDSDFDGDGVNTCKDICSSDPLKTDPGSCGCGNLETDSDFDGFPNCVDLCGEDSAKLLPGLCGCGMKEDLTCVGIHTPRELTPNLKITQPPVVIVTGDDVTVLMEQFAGASVSKATRKGNSLEFAVTFEAKGKPKLTIKYELNLKQSGVGKRGAKAAVSKRNEYTFKNLSSGSYTVKYRAQIIQKGSIAGRSGFSPVANFKIP